MQPRALLTPVVALMVVFLSGCEQELSASRSNDSGKTTGESWICATVGDADFDSWQPIGPIEGLTLHFEAQMVLEREVYEKGLFQYLVRSNVGPIFLKKKSGEVLLLSTGHSPPLPSGSGEWGMMERALADANASLNPPVAPTISPAFKDADGGHHQFFLDVVGGNGCSLQKSLALCFANCSHTQVTVPSIRPPENQSQELATSGQIRQQSTGRLGSQAAILQQLIRPAAKRCEAVVRRPKSRQPGIERLLSP